MKQQAPPGKDLFGVQEWVGLILSRQKRQSGEITNAGTAFLIAHDLAVTAAYNIYMINEKLSSLDLGSIYFFPGAHQTLKPKNFYKVVSIRFPEKYLNSSPVQKRFHQYALLKLERKVENITFLPPLCLQYHKNQNDALRLFGYQSFKCTDLLSNYYWAEFKGQENNGSAILQSQLKCQQQDFHWKKIDQELVQHKFQTSNGIGGGPIVVKRQEQLVIVGFHIVIKTNRQVREAKLITQNMVKLFIKWAKEMKSQSSSFLIARDTLAVRQISFQNGEIVQKKNQQQTIKELNTRQSELEKKLKQSVQTIQQFQKSSLELREQIVELKRIQSKYEALSNRIQDFKGITKLPSDKINLKLAQIDRIIFQHSIDNVGDTILEQSVSKSNIKSFLDELE